MKVKKIPERVYQSCTVFSHYLNRDGNNVKVVITHDGGGFTSELTLPVDAFNQFGFPHEDILRSRLKRDINVFVNHFSFIGV